MNENIDTKDFEPGCYDISYVLHGVLYSDIVNVQEPIDLPDSSAFVGIGELDKRQQRVRMVVQTAFHGNGITIGLARYDADSLPLSDPVHALLVEREDRWVGLPPTKHGATANRRKPALLSMSKH